MNTQTINCDRETARDFLVNQTNLVQQLRAFLRSSIISALRKSKHISFPVDCSSIEDTRTLSLLENIRNLLDERNLPFTKSVLSAELGLDLDNLPVLCPQGHKTPLPVSRQGREQGMQTSLQTPSGVPPEISRERELSRREKVLELEERELRIRENLIERERQKLQLERTRLETWRQEENARLAHELEQARINLASEL